MQNRNFHAVMDDISQIIQAIDEIAAEAHALSPRETLQAAVSRPPGEGRRALEAIAANLDRIVAKAQEVELLVADVPDPTLTGALAIPAGRLREAVTSLVVSAYGAAGNAARPSSRFHIV